MPKRNIPPLSGTRINFSTVLKHESKGNQSYQNKASDGKSIFRRETCASTKQKAKGVVDNQSSYLGLNKENGSFCIWG